jgi:hypothetical protein
MKVGRFLKPIRERNERPVVKREAGRRGIGRLRKESGLRRKGDGTSRGGTS